MLIPTHRYNGAPVRLEDGQFVRPNGSVIAWGRGIRKEDFIPVVPVERTLTQEQMALVMQAARRPSGNPMATNARGDVATLVAENRVQLSISDRGGNNKHWMIELPATFTMEVIVLEEPDAN